MRSYPVKITFFQYYASLILKVTKSQKKISDLFDHTDTVNHDQNLSINAIFTY